jgi:Trk-type K+ transport system membrane component
MKSKLKQAAAALFADNQAQSQMDLPGVMIVLVIAGVVGFVGLQVMSTVIDTTQLSENDSLYNASESLETSINDAWGLVGVAFIVVILAVIIVYLYGLRGGRGR